MDGGTVALTRIPGDIFALLRVFSLSYKMTPSKIRLLFHLIRQKKTGRDEGENARSEAKKSIKRGNFFGKISAKNAGKFVSRVLFPHSIFPLEMKELLGKFSLQNGTLSWTFSAPR